MALEVNILGHDVDVDKKIITCELKPESFALTIFWFVYLPLIASFVF